MTFCFVVIFIFCLRLYFDLFVFFFFWSYFIWLTWSRIHFLCADRYQIATGVYEYQRKKSQVVHWFQMSVTHCVDPCDKKEHNTKSLLCVLYSIVMNMKINDQLCCMMLGFFLFDYKSFCRLFLFCCYQIYIQIRFQSIWIIQQLSWNGFYIMQIELNNCFGFFSMQRTSVDHFIAWKRGKVYEMRFSGHFTNFVYFNTLNNTCFGKKFVSTVIEKGARFGYFKKNCLNF